MSRLVAIGLPESGKTTFLAALWHETESEEIKESLRLEKISDEAKHVNDIRTEWLSFKPVTRTVQGQEQLVSLWLRNEHNVIGEVSFPDLSGEEFRQAWKERHWAAEYDQLIGGAKGLLLFIHPNGVKEPVSIADVQRFAEAACPEGVEPDDNKAIIRDSEKVVEATEEWDPLRASTQVMLVELLQFVRLRTHTEFPIRLAVIVSAWDIVKREHGAKYSGEFGAQGWLKDRLPYLDQYLRANAEFLVVRTYGVSAQGGDLSVDRAALKALERASQRILIEGSDCACHDISEPIRWCLGLR